jgi:hypothetical protein
MDSTPTTPTNVPEDSTTVDTSTNDVPFYSLDDSTQLEILFSFLGLTDNPDSVKTLNTLNKMADNSVKFITMTSGKNAGEKRQVYHDTHGKAYYKIIDAQKRSRRVYLEDYIDAEGNPRHASASTVMKKQYKRILQNMKPVALFGDAPPVDDDASVEEEEEDQVVIKDDAKELSL